MARQEDKVKEHRGGKFLYVKVILGKMAQLIAEL